VIRLAFDVDLEQGSFRLALADDAEVEVLGLFGPSGSGKTSLLEVIAGLRTPARGRVAVGGRTLLDTARRHDVPPHRRRVGYVPQDGALFPHLDVRRNVMYGAGRPGSASLDVAHVIPEAAERRLATAESRRDQVSATLEIAPLMNRSVRELSGGERQRVAIARALMSSPRILLLDEPMTGLDRDRKERVLPYLLRIRRDLHVPMVYVTHDARELGEIADRVLRLENGKLVAAGPPGSILSSRRLGA
jgi:molybdate transport system ATP-binding protein